MNMNCKIDNFQIIEEIGKGEYGIVYKARHKDKNHLYALKQIDLNDPKEGVPSTTIREIALLKDIDHPNIIKLYNVIHYSKKLYLVLEICSSDLKKFLTEKPEAVSIQDVKIIIYQILKGLDVLDSCSIMHRDLKPQNILVIKPVNNIEKKLNVDFPIIKLADFGLARSCSIPVQTYTPGVVTLWYRAPELLLGYPKYNESIEIWSLGCIFYELLTKKALFTGDTEINQLKRIFEVLGSPKVNEWPELKLYPNYETIKDWPPFEAKSLKELLPNFDELGYDLLTSMLQMSPKARISTSDALEHKWFDDIRDKVETLYNQTGGLQACGHSDFACDLSFQGQGHNIFKALLQRLFLLQLLLKDQAIPPNHNLDCQGFIKSYSKFQNMENTLSNSQTLAKDEPQGSGRNASHDLGLHSVELSQPEKKDSGSCRQPEPAPEDSLPAVNSKIEQDILEWRNFNKQTNIEPYLLPSYTQNLELVCKDTTAEVSRTDSFHYSLTSNDLYYVLFINSRSLYISKIGTLVNKNFNALKLMCLKENSSVTVKRISISNNPDHNILLVFLSNLDLLIISVHETPEGIKPIKLPLKISLKCYISKNVWIGNTVYLNTDNEIQNIVFTNISKFQTFSSQEELNSNCKYDKLFIFPGCIDDFDVSYQDKLFYILSSNSIFIFNSLGICLYSFTPALDKGEAIRCIKAFRQAPSQANLLSIKDEKDFNVKDMIISLTNQNKMLVHDVYLLKYDSEEDFRIAKYDMRHVLKLPQTSLRDPTVTISKANDKIFIHNRQVNAIFCLKVNEYYQRANDDVKSQKDVIPFVDSIMPIVLPESTLEIVTSVMDKEKYFNNFFDNSHKTYNFISSMAFKEILLVNSIDVNRAMKFFNVPFDALFKIYEECANRSMANIGDNPLEENATKSDEPKAKKSKKKKRSKNKGGKQSLDQSTSSPMKPEHSNSNIQNATTDDVHITSNPPSDPPTQDAPLPQVVNQNVDVNQGNKESPNDQLAMLANLLGDRNGLSNPFVSEPQGLEAGTVNLETGFVRNPPDTVPQSFEMIENKAQSINPTNFDFLQQLLPSKVNDSPQKLTGLVDVRVIEEMMYGKSSVPQPKEDTKEAAPLNLDNKNSSENDPDVDKLETPQFIQLNTSKPFSFMDQSSNSNQNSNVEKTEVNAQNEEMIKDLLPSQANPSHPNNPTIERTNEEPEVKPLIQKSHSRSIEKTSIGKNSSIKANESKEKAAATEDQPKKLEKDPKAESKGKSAHENTDPFKKNLADTLTMFHEKLYSKVGKQFKDLRNALNKDILNTFASSARLNKKSGGEDLCRYIEKNTMSAFQKQSTKTNDAYIVNMSMLSSKINDKFDLKMDSMTQVIDSYTKELENHIRDSNKLNELLNTAINNSTEGKTGDSSKVQNPPNAKVLSSIIQTIGTIQEDQNEMVSAIINLNTKVQTLEKQMHPAEKDPHASYHAPPQSHPTIPMHEHMDFGAYPEYRMAYPNYGYEPYRNQYLPGHNHPAYPRYPPNYEYPSPDFNANMGYFNRSPLYGNANLLPEHRIHPGHGPTHFDLPYKHDLMPNQTLPKGDDQQVYPKSGSTDRLEEGPTPKMSHDMGNVGSRADQV